MVRGGVAVYVFFVLSGFLAAVNFDKEKFVEDGAIKSCFYSLYKRMKKYYPIYFVFLLIGIRINFSGWSNFLKCCLLIQSYFFDASIALTFNWPCWFLSSMMICFFLSPFICFLLQRIGNKSKVVFIVIIFIALSLWGLHWNTDMVQNDTGTGYYLVYICPFTRLLDFITGVLFGQLYTSFKWTSFHSNQLDLGILGFFLLQLLLYKRIPVGIQYTIAWMPATLALIWVFAKNSGIVEALTRNKFLQHTGKISFELYIVHRLILLFMSRQDTSMVIWCLTTLLIYIVAELGHRILNWNTVISSAVKR